MEKLDIGGYQYKALALIASSFDNTFLIDADSFPVLNPDLLFESDVYQKTGMITWPDYWRRTTSPKYYEVANITVEQKQVRHLNDFKPPKPINCNGVEECDNFYKNDVNFHDRSGSIPEWSTESGQFLVRKSTHFDVLMLALYYNLDGPKGYYPLLSQSAAGEGDKETFVAAATYYGKSYYQVARPCYSIGRWQRPGTGFWDQTTIIQSDPITDYQIVNDLLNQKESKSESKSSTDSETDTDKDKEKEVTREYDYKEDFKSKVESGSNKPMFHHIHHPKLNPYKIWKSDVTQDNEGNKIRILGDFYRSEVKGEIDLEAKLFELFKDNLCDILQREKGKAQFKAFEGEDRYYLCKFLNEHIEFLKKSY
ncbi:unnamed protein product [Ambrosiozyma monospora]|uniref:Unnamed protein product n=1 Tax=Ambrosiozyma monospora TaxID=43982 RepID=A0ACB5T3E1_AMBMO|nr:unnamed protein product [Ambrosiozyma monospora]